MGSMRLALPLLLPLVVVLSGCGAKAQTVGGVPRMGKAPRVVSLGPSTTEIVASNFNVALLVGRSEKDDYPANVAQVPVVASVKPDFEKIKGANATFLVFDADLYNPDDVKRIEASGVESFPFKAHTVAGFEKELYELSGKLGSETGVSGYVDRIERERSIAEGDPPASPPKVAVVLDGGKYLAGTESFLADVVRIAGGKLVGPAADKFDAMGAEALVAAAPDAIVLATTKEAAAKEIATLRADPRFATTPAVKNGRISAIEQDIVLRRGTRVDKLIESMHKIVALDGAKTQ